MMSIYPAFWFHIFDKFGILKARLATRLSATQDLGATIFEAIKRYCNLCTEVRERPLRRRRRSPRNGHNGREAERLVSGSELMSALGAQRQR